MQSRMRAKRFFLFSLLSFVAMAVLYFCAVDQLAIPERLIDRSYKQFLLKASRDVAKKIIIEGGSNTVYGISGRQIEDHFGRLTLNLGDNGSYPLSHKLRRLRPYLNQGDLVLLPLEWNHYMLGNIYPGNYVLPMLDRVGSNAFYYKALPLWQRIDFVYHQVPFALAVQRTLQLNALEPRNSELRRSEAIALARYGPRLDADARGDYSMPEQGLIGLAGSKTTTCDEFVLKDQIAKGFLIAQEFSENLRLMRTIASETGAIFVFTWPNVVDLWGDGCYRSDEVVEHLDRYAAAIEEEVTQYGFAFIGDYRDSRFDKSCFWDSYYHLSQECVKTRTDRLILEMESHGIDTDIDYDLERTHKIQFSYLGGLVSAQGGFELQLNAPIAAGQATAYINYVSGWSLMEPWGRWSLGKQSSVLIFGVDKNVVALRITGKYYHGAEATKVWINENYMGAHELEDYSLDLTGVSVDKGILDIRFLHGEPITPASQGHSNDTRAIKYGIESITLLSAGE